MESKNDQIANSRKANHGNFSFIVGYCVSEKDRSSKCNETVRMMTLAYLKEAVSKAQ
jgi:hypothetical protein